VRWSELTEVRIVTTDAGPWSEDVYVVLVGAGERSGCLVPNAVLASSGVLDRLQALPGFDNRAVVEAMGSTANAVFTCWKRAA
jgi:hypothetical protein